MEVISMSQVMLNNVWVELTAEQILAVVRQLPPKEREKVRCELEAEEWKREFKELLARIHTRVDRSPVSDEEIDREVQVVREARHARRVA
jgi:uncharacterized OsmC-like protein